MRVPAHTGRTARAARAAFLDEGQNLTVVADLGPGLVDDRDLEALSERLGFPDGAPMEDDTLEERLAEAAAGGRAPDLGLAWEGGGCRRSGSSSRPCFPTGRRRERS